MEPQPPQPQHDEATAYHEAGHAVVALALDRPVHRVSVLPALFGPIGTVVKGLADDPTANKVLRDDPTVSKLLRDDPTVSKVLRDDPTVSKKLADDPTVSKINRVLKDDPTVSRPPGRG